jgi:uncharacterized membrane protein YqhA
MPGVVQEANSRHLIERARLDNRPVYTGLVVAEVALWWDFLQTLWYKLALMPTVFSTHISFMYHWHDIRY